MRDNLPHQVSKLLREELEKGAKALSDNAQLLEEIKAVEKLNDEHGNIKIARRNLKKREDDVKHLETLVYEKNMELNDTILTLRLKFSERYAAKLENTLAGLVRNTEWREEIQRTNGDTRFNSDGSTVPVETSRTTTKEAK